MGHETAALLDNPIVQIVIVIFSIWLFLKFCALCKKVSLPGGLKKWIIIITSAGIVYFNWMFSKATEGMGPSTAVTDPRFMTITMVAALVAVLLFSFALIAETKE